MRTTHRLASLATTLTLLALGHAAPVLAGGFQDGVRETLGSRFEPAPELSGQTTTASRLPAGSMDRLRHWNEIAIDASGLDHTPVAPGDTRVFGEQLGPGRSARAMAIVHIAIFDSVNAIVGGYRSYTGLPAAPSGSSR